MDKNTVLHKLIEIIQYKNTYQYQSSGIQPQDMYILERVYFQETIKIKDLSTRYSVPPSTLTGIIDRLEAKKYIQRIRANADRRAVEVAVAEAGREVVERHISEDKLFSHNLFNALQKDRKELLLELLNDLVANVKKEDLFKDKI